MAAKTTITPSYTVSIPGKYLGPKGDWHEFLMEADSLLELHAAIGATLGLTTYTRLPAPTGGGSTEEGNTK